MSVLNNFLLKFRLPLILGLNVILTVCSLLAALNLRFDFNWSEVKAEYFGAPLILLVLFRQAAYVYFNLNGGYWRYASMGDLRSIINAHFLSSVFFAASIWWLQLSFPRSVIIGEFLISIVFCGGSRFLVRTFSEYLVGREMMKLGSKAKKAIILGAGNSGHLLVKLLQTSRHIPFVASAILDDLDRLKGSSVYGARVEGRISDLGRILAMRRDVSVVLVAIPSLGRQRLSEIQNICEQHNVSLKKLQSFEDIACLDISDGLQEINIESVLEKETQVEHEAEISNELAGKCVLVTGAGGSIGSELVRQVISFKPAKVILLDNSEYNLFSMTRSLKESACDLEYVIANICDVKRMAAVFEKEKPEYVFHAAAYKHVPLMEDNCYEALVNNVIGTLRLHELALANGVRRFVFISTDKAVDPCSVMGCSKKIAEMLIQYQAFAGFVQGGAGSVRMKSAVVRFGNVINSAGSVIPVFKEQIANGGPITVTHPDMDRFFMSIREAVRLVLTAGTLSENGEIYVLDMGKKIKIVDLAKKMLGLYGRRDIEIVFSGLRPGEKLTEDLLASYERLSPSPMRKVSRLRSSLVITDKVIQWINEMEKKAGSMSNSEIGEAMKAFVAEMEKDVRAGSVLQSGSAGRDLVGNV